MFLTRWTVLKTLILVIPPTVVLGLLLVVLSPVDLFFRSIIYQGSRLGPVGILIKKIWMSWILKCHGIKITKSGLTSHELQKMRGIVFAANHQSLLDIPAIFSTISPHSVFLAKDELKWIPIFGWAAWIAGTEFIDRRAGARSSTLRRLDLLLRLGLSVVVFPEGTRSRDGNLLPFKRGAFVLAIKNGAPVIPITITGSSQCLAPHSFVVKRGTIHLHFGKPILTQDLTLEGRSDLTNSVFEVIRNQLEKTS